MELANKQTVCWVNFVYEQWHMVLAATSSGLCYVGSPNGHFDELADWVKFRLPNHDLVHDDVNMKSYLHQFEEYFQGRRTLFTFPVDFYGTPFQISVWEALNDIPYGSSYSYSEFAECIQKSNSVRAVAAAIGANPVLIAVPCHRVIGKSGALTGYRGGLEMKAALLKLERDNPHFGMA
jgi:methylated-DNA-[protein]-cysteine S-methyltransferase